MNRTLKFRAWDKNAERMVPWEELKDNVMPGHLFDQNERFAAMQFTGLHDKNRKGIYEGDIVRFISDDFEVLYRTEQAAFAFRYIGKDRLKAGYLSRYQIMGMRLEIIGNIYESPELLNT